METCQNFSIFVFSYDAKQFRTNFIAMVKHCIAYGCTNRSSKRACKSLSWHLLPSKNKKRLAEWLVKIRRENTPVTKNSYLCSDHFSKECFIKLEEKENVSNKALCQQNSLSQRKKPCYQATNQTTNRIKRINKVNNSNSATCEIKNNSERNEHDSGVDIEQMANVNCHDSPQDVESLNEQLRRELKLMEEKFTRLQNDYEATQVWNEQQNRKLEKQIKEEQ